MLTLLPLLRITAAVVLGVMLLLSSLWAIGIEIMPLLAGASPGGARMNGTSATTQRRAMIRPRRSFYDRRHLNCA